MNKADVISHFGSGKEVAKALGIKPSAVYQWPQQVPELRAFQLEKITNGVLKNTDSKTKAA
ncbi:Cro/CI family transcriptional regulator [Photobacterium chitinilyticum]|uniref:Cro/CI family transcriptional regulator n=1 Tax=Photobacterium chitinilyticum TaxID=2485123 RepID=UPI003D0DF1DC